MSVTDAFTSAILPIVAIAAVGYVVGRRTDAGVESLTTVALNVFLPALVFHGVATTDLSGGTVLDLGIAIVAYIAVMMAIAYAGGRAFDVPDAALPAMMLASTFPNSGFVGIPLNGFVFGDFGRTTATIYLTIQGVLLYTIGVYVVSAGGDDGAGVLDGLREVVRLPLVHAIVVAAAVRGLGLVPPVDGTFMTTVDTVGSAAVPVMLVVVGIQLADVDLGSFRRAALPTGLKLLVAPVVAVGVALAVGFADPRVANVFLIECATPAAVTPLALTIAYGDDDLSTAEYTSTVIFVSTVLSVVVLTALVVAVQSGWLF